MPTFDNIGTEGPTSAVNLKMTQYYPTLLSTLEAVAQSSSGGPKNVISCVSASIGGAVSANNPCSLPRNEQQVVDVRRRQKKATYGTCATDELVESIP